MLEIDDLHVSYGQIKALKGISLSVPDGAIVTLIGGNGAGKTTLLRTISGLHRAKSGTICWNGETIAHRAPHDVVKLGLAHAPEGRMIFANLTVQENLRMGAYLRKDPDGIKHDLDYVFTIFPRLKERLWQPGGTLSGGEQQMLAIARALMSKPKMLLLDEPSLGIAPILVRTIFEKIVEINRELGVAVLLVEQNANLALAIAHTGYVIETGKIVLSGTASELAQNEEVQHAYLGTA
ncbi:MAG TPA: ABC transporter ATP-binding protein [Candidatus Kapabacteria bacterium]|jgi:branched-chain amino acid transport system ATP-binding protein|nr:ABC transporter ATP-binding protein [Candidatus Kapabacteria bacterium]